MCVILYTKVNGKRILAKNRDRIYYPNIEIIHEILDGIEVVYIHDLDTGWIEGMNSNKTGLINSTLNMKDSKSKSYKKTRKTIKTLRMGNTRKTN